VSIVDSSSKLSACQCDIVRGTPPPVARTASSVTCSHFESAISSLELFFDSSYDCLELRGAMHLGIKLAVNVELG
jgi:hypothetical protein